MQIFRPIRNKRSLLVALVGVLALLASCGKPQPPAKVPAVIEQLVATPATVSLGESSTIDWVVTGNFSSIALMAGETLVNDSLLATGSEVVEPTSTTEYTLVVRDADDNEVTESVNVTVTSEPEITSFSATPDTVGSGDASVLSWTVTGSATNIALRVKDGAEVANELPATGTRTVEPTATTTYELVATWAEGDIVSETTVTVTAVGTAPSVTSVVADVVPGSQFTVAWVATDATSFEVVAVSATDDTDTVAVPGGEAIASNATSATLPIPDSAHQIIRVIATNSAGSDSMDTTNALENVVLNDLDYDPYDPEGGPGETPVAGSFRQVLADAPEDAVIGFAADVVAGGSISLNGVNLGTWGDAHIYAGKNVRISGPAQGFTLRGVSGWTSGDLGTEFSWRSRVLYVAAGADVILDNITLTGGAFIFYGAGARNLGNLTMNGGAVTGNRAWYTGGGISNLGTLVLNETEVSGNTAATINGEVGAGIPIRGNLAYTTGPIDIGGWGGGIYNEGGSATSTLNNTSVSGNLARLSGGGISNDSGSVFVSGGSVELNQATDAAYIDGSAGFSAGGGIYTEGVLVLTDVVLDGNEAFNFGGGLAAHTPGTADVNSSIFSNNEADYGGGIQVWHCNSGTIADVLTLDGATTFSDNLSRLGLDDNQGSSAVPCAGLRSAAVSRSAFLPSAEQLSNGNRR